MSVAGILSTAALSIGSQFFHSRARQMKQECQQLGADLQSGNLTAAQADFAALQKLRPQSSSSSTKQASSSINQDFDQLAADLKAGNTTAAEQDFTKLQQDVQSQQTQGHHHHHHTHNSSGDSSSGAASQLFSQLGSALQSGNLSAAQQAYSAMLQEFQLHAGVSGTNSQASGGGISVSA